MHKFLKNLQVGIFAALLVVFAVSTGWAQLTTATLSGIVTDKSGAVIPNAKVVITNDANGSVVNVVSNSTGVYNAPNLQAGTYTVKASAAGFSSEEQKGLKLDVGANQTLAFSLAVGEVSQTVEVTEVQPVVETENATIGATVGQKTVVELPLNGRDWTQLATLQPGISAVHAQASTGAGANRGNRGFGDQLTDSGHRPNENTYRLDGININDYSNGAPGSTLGAVLGVDAIQEFSVVTTDYTAEYGRTSGAVLNAVTKSGTNRVHGSAYFFDRDKIFDARNFFDPPTIPPFRRIQFGGSAGGPIRKDKTFIFGDYEGVRQGQSGAGTSLILSAAAQAGNLCSIPGGADPSSPCVPHTVAVDSKVQPFLALYHIKGIDTGSIGNGDVDVYKTSGLKVLNENFYTGRVDNKFGEKDQANATFFYDKAPLTQPDAANNFISEVFSSRRTLAFTENHVFSANLTNVFRFGYTHVQGLVNAPVSAINPAAADKTLCSICTPVTQNAPEIFINGVTAVGGLGYLSEFTHNYNSFQANDDLFYIVKNHTLKFGFAFERMQYDLGAFIQANALFNFLDLQPQLKTAHPSAIENFLTNKPAGVITLSPTIRKTTQTRDSLFGGYIQDDWRVSPRFTANIGLRYEMLTNPTEGNNAFAFLTNFYTSPSETPYRTLFNSNPTTKNFDPRIGFAYDPFGNGKTAIRAGIGIFDVLPLPYIYTIGDGVTLPFVKNQSAGNAGSPLPQGSFPIIPSSVNFGSSNAVRYVDRNPHRSYATNYNINIEQELTRKLGLFVGYVGSRTLHAPWTADDSNQVVPGKVNGVYTWQCSGNPCVALSGADAVPRANPNVGYIREILWDDAASYQGFQSQLKLHDIRNLEGQVAYSYGKCTDEGSGAQLGDPFQNSITSLMFFDKAHRLGPCDYDIRQNLSANAIWTLPTPHFGGKAGEYVLGGWQTGAILGVSTGIPFTLVLNGDVLGQNYTDAGYDYPNRVPGCKAINGGINYVNTSCFVTAPPTANGLVLGNNGRNSLYGPKTVNLDFSLFKNLHLRDSLNAQIRGEFFNVLNHTNLQAPVDNYTLNVGGAGTIDSTSTFSRQIQLGAKLTF